MSSNFDRFQTPYHEAHFPDKQDIKFSAFTIYDYFSELEKENIELRKENEQLKSKILNMGSDIVVEREFRKSGV